MSWQFFRSIKKRRVEVVASDPVVVKIKEKTHRVAKEAKDNADRLNKLFESDNITLNIHIARGGKHV